MIIAMPRLQVLLDEIARALPDGGDWCTLEKAEALACLIVALRPRRIVEIGIWRGGSFVPMVMALRHAHASAGSCMAIAIDPWDPRASVAGEEPANAQWWGDTVGVRGHEDAYDAFVARLEREGLSAFVEIIRKPSDEARPPSRIDLLHVDGNHTDQAIRDVERFAPEIVRGGVLVLDDMDWSSGSVARAHERALTLGFRNLYPVDKAMVMVRS